MNSEPNHNPPLTFSVTAEDAGERLDVFLAAHIEGWSRARLHRLIENADVLVNGSVSKPAHKLRANDHLEIELTPTPSTSFAPEDIPVEVVYEDDDLIVVNKPAGIVVHPAAGVDSGTLANALAFHFQQLSTTGGAVRPGIVHRLDKGTSGLLVVAKTEKAHEHLADQFRDRKVFKSYVALVHGQVEKEGGEIDQPIARDPRNRTRMAVVRAGRPSLSIYKVRRRFERFTLLDVELKTGRTHQIRVHLAWLKHPVVGDEVYGAGRDKTVNNPVIRSRIAKLGRQFLHAERLGFRHPRTAEQLRFTAPIPAELHSLLDQIEC
ncbi:MAG TPA: RluA family pseudouridine synthase [Pyrinomonadaceae bacterium]|nr:RluA family pseudouridine synthase [Pyrinomonadaceae bacterium]